MAEYWEREGAGTAGGGPGNAPDARVAPDWLGEHGAAARGARTQPQRSARQKQSPAERGASLLAGPLAGSLGFGAALLSGRGRGFARGATPRIPQELRAGSLKVPGNLAGAEWQNGGYFD